MKPVPIRVVTWDLGSVRAEVAQIAAVLREVRPDFAGLQSAPAGFRWRSRTAALARQAEMLTAGGGPASSGNLVLGSVRVHVFGTQQTMSGGQSAPSDIAVAVAEVSGVRVVVCATRLGASSMDRTRRATELVDRLRAFGGDHQILCAQPAANPAEAIQVSPGVKVLDWWLGEPPEGSRGDRDRPVVADLLLLDSDG
jgi:endonuclease/exonuclease/phosphatase family metal-dependent hydrolase